MGKMDDVLHRYLDDAERFADFYNGALFGGQQIIDAGELSEASEQYKEVAGKVLSKKSEPKRKYITRNRDIKKYLKTGGVLRILAIENQNLVDYSMPFRCMEYDTLEYRKQLKAIHRKNDTAGDYEMTAERLCKVKKGDRLHPVYTLCLYHGEEPWDGPRTLKDMMEFANEDAFEKYFSDYPMLLYCVNDKTDLSVFHTELKELFTVMQYRRDKVKMKKVLEEDENYRHLSEDTMEAISVVMNEPSIWRNRRMYKSDLEEEESYDMCQALREWAEDERNEARTEAILDLLAVKGDVPDELRDKVLSQTDADILKKWILAAAKAESLKDFEKTISI